MDHFIDSIGPFGLSIPMFIFWWPTWALYRHMEPEQGFGWQEKAFRIGLCFVTGPWLFWILLAQKGLEYWIKRDEKRSQQ